MKVAFQGDLGAFSQQAIRQLLGAKAQPFPCQRFDQVFEFLIVERFGSGQRFGVEDLPSQREYGLRTAVPPHRGRPAGRLSLDDEQF